MSIISARGTRPRARLTSQGQITVPKSVREALELRPGDELEFDMGRSSVVLRPRHRRSILDFAGIAGEGSHLLPRTAAELDERIEQANVARARRRFTR
jgi:AbrB family looped-hinge helix DNA binding protein